MSNRWIPIVVAGALVGCGGGGGGDNGGPDASTNIPAMVTITGTAQTVSALGNMPAAGLTIEAYSNADENTPVATTTSDAQGNYTLVVTTNGMALDGYIKATGNNLLDTYLYPPAPLTADFDGASINMVSPTTFDLLANTLCRGNQDAAKGTIAVLVEDASGNPVTGATIASNPAATATCYDGNNGLPSSSATATASSGLGYLFNVTGSATVSADASGTTFQSHGVVARAGALTTTLVEP